MKTSHTQTKGFRVKRKFIKAELRGKFIVLDGFRKKLVRSHASNLTTHLKALEQKK